MAYFRVYCEVEVVVEADNEDEAANKTINLLHDGVDVVSIYIGKIENEE